MRRLSVFLFVFAVSAHAENPASWTRAVKPVHIAGPIYYVGTEDLGSYLLADDAGLILLDVPLEQNAPLVLNNVTRLGFDAKTIRILLNSHAHIDHIGGFAFVKEKTGAQIYLSARDAELAARGGLRDPNFGDQYSYPAVKADHVVKDGEVVRLGKLAMTAMLTPGHTPGCTTWRTTIVENGKPLDVVFLCSVSAPGYRLVKNEAYPNIFEDYRATFAKLRRVDPDIFLANHTGFFHFAGKVAKLKDGGPNPFIARGELATHLDAMWKQLAAEEKKQR